MFNINVIKAYWIHHADDDPDDLCLHGYVVVTIGNEQFETECTISAAALYHLKTLTENHFIDTENQMLPCCGLLLFPNDANDNVNISGCQNGIDWSVTHKNGGVEITTEHGIKTFVTMSEYQKQVFAFADFVKEVYDNCTQKNIPSNEFDRRGYIAFWNEWTRRRSAS